MSRSSSTIALKWATEEMKKPSVAELNAPERSGPSIFTAVRELGLELKPIKDSLDTIGIDHAEMPSEN
jgi:uncharacterized protein (TIGR03435 family)